MQISLGRIVVLTGIIIAVLLYFAFVGQADGAYCSKTCQARLAEQKEKDDPTTSFSERQAQTEKKCYGIYCDREPTNKNKAIDDFIKKVGEKNFISIRVQKSCEMTGSCPTIKELADLYDNSNKYLSGDFYFDEEKNQWHRSPPKIHNVFELYKLQKIMWTVFVDPDDYTWKRTKQIEIYPELRYISRDDIIENQVRTEYVGLYHEPCYRAKIGWDHNGTELLLDVLNHFMSDCKEPVKYDPTVEIFMNSTIFADCDRKCFYNKQLSKMELKAFYQTEKEFNDSYIDKKDQPRTCYGIYCDREEDKRIKDPRTIKEKIEELEQKEERRTERLKELEDIQECEKFKRKDDTSRSNINCNENKNGERDDYLEEMRKIYPDLKSGETYRNSTKN